MLGEGADDFRCHVVCDVTIVFGDLKTFRCHVVCDVTVLFCALCMTSAYQASRGANCPSPTSTTARQDLKQAREDLAAAPFDGPQDRLNFVGLVYKTHAGPHIEYVNGQSGSETFGELEPSLLQQMDLGRLLSPGQLFLDMGAGYGGPSLFAGLLTGCDTISYEISEAPAKLSMPMYRSVFAKCADEFAKRVEKFAKSPDELAKSADERAESADAFEKSAFSLGCMQFLHEDMRCDETGLGRAIADASVILVNNLVFEEECKFILSFFPVL